MIYSIQYLRAFACISVVFTHTFGGFGAQGVDIFFVISGYIMAYLITERNNTAKNFFIARYTRIAPLYYIATFLAIVLGLGYEVNFKHLIYSLLFIKFEWTKPILSIGWTLEYEFVFYTLCSLVLFFVRSKNFQIPIILFGLIVGSFLVDYVLYPEKAYGFFLEFFYGIVIYSLIRNNKPANSLSIKLLILVFSFMLLIMSDSYIYETKSLPFRFLGYGIPAAIFVYSIISIENFLPKISFIKKLGDASFSIYVFHTIIIHVYYSVTGTYRYFSITSDFLSFVIPIIIGTLIHLMIERKLILFFRKLNS